MPAVSDRGGEVIGGKYRVLRPLGAGAYGAVYEAQAHGGRRVAIKVLRDPFIDLRERQRFEREGALLLDVVHPHIVQLLDLGEHDGEPYLVFELLQGRSLAQELSRVGFMSATRVAGIAKQVLSALTQTHRRGIVHRDIKPSNVQLCSSVQHVDRVKLLDYGVAKLVCEGLEQLTEPGAMVGSPGYMAPEQIRSCEVGPAADIFSVGVLMAELLHGARFMGETLLDVCRQHMDPGPFELPRSVRLSELGDVIVHAMAKEPERRFASAEAMTNAIDLAVRGADSAPRSASGTVLLPEHLDSEVSPSSTVPLDAETLSEGGVVDAPWLRRG